MKNILLLLLLQLPVLLSFGQKTEITVQVSSGLFSYGGKSVTPNTNAFINDTPPYYQAYTPYGERSGFSYGFGVQAQRVTNKNFILGVSVGFDRQSSIAGFDSIGTMGGRYAAENGKVSLKNDLIGANPYFGYRSSIRGINVDITAGVNAGFIIRSAFTLNHAGIPDFSSGKNKSENYWISSKVDLSPSIRLGAEYRRVGVSAAYYHGLVNYMKGLGFRESAQVYSRYLRLGVSYRII